MGVKLIGSAVALVALTVAFGSLEWVAPANPEQFLFRRRGIRIDLCYWFFTPLVTRAVTRLAIGWGRASRSRRASSDSSPTRFGGDLVGLAKPFDAAARCRAAAVATGSRAAAFRWSREGKERPPARG